jgi:3-(3-hydroxy-phenyl)propionate hydroxylase
MEGQMDFTMTSTLLEMAGNTLDTFKANISKLETNANVLTTSGATFVIVILIFSLFIRQPSGNTNNKGSFDATVTHPHLPVLVVGAGPTGLTLANVLARYGVPVRIIEQKPHLSRHTKATNLMQRNQELVSALGLLDSLSQKSGQMRRLMVHAYGKAYGPRTMRLKESPFTDVVLCGQHNFEQVMADGLSQIGVEIEFGTRFIGATQEGKSVRATFENSQGEETTASFSYLVGCDGHVGITRKFTKLDFETTKTGVAIRQVDCKLQWRRLSSMEQMWLFYFDHGFAVVVPLPGDIHRVLCIEPKSTFPERKPTLDEMQAKLRLVANDDALLLSDPHWFSYTDLSMGLAPSLQDNRILLAGDVGNPVLPNGGQGMNTGITDAFNLGWKLAAVYRHSAPQALLHTYNEERHAVRSALQTSQFNSLKYTTLVTPKLMQIIFTWIAEPLLNLGGEYAMAQTFSELTIHTRNSPLSLDADRKSARGSIRAGDRALDALVVRGFETTTIYSLIYRGAWTLLAFGGCRKIAESITSLRLAISQLRRPDLMSYVISTLSAQDQESEHNEKASSLITLYDLDEETHRVYGVTHPSIFLVRPDGHVGARASPSEVIRLRTYLNRWVPDATQIFSPLNC